MTMITKKTGWLVAIFALTLSASVYAASGDVRFTVHNLSNNNTAADGMTYSAAGGQTNRKFYSTTVDQVCIFCHTPHNASPASQLWNKTLSATAPGAFRLYTSSTTLSPTTKHTSALTASSPSILCLSCHDGKTAINVLHNSPVGTPSGSDKIVDIGGGAPVAQPIEDFFGFGVPARANLGATSTDLLDGTNLTDDHPIGFVYANAASDKPADLRTVANVNIQSSNKIRFFNGGKMECSTCHDPHVKYDGTYGGDEKLRPFLVMDNTGSKLCIACHIK